ncbi:MAG: Rpn family recombination-promoting nuclease/putative transposase [Treponema sp.]|nr:Rpn family recombination-promoting nuclease/putative transposase [Treponema sp.]
MSAVIGRPLTVLVITSNEPAIDNLRDRQIRFDITCKAEFGELINMEMSLNPDTHEPTRLEFYAGKLFTGQDIHGIDKNYDDLCAAYQVAMLRKERFFRDGEFLHQFEYYDPERRMSLGGRSRIVTLELSKLDKVIEKSVKTMTASEHWAVFFRYLTDKRRREKINEVLQCEEGIAMAGEVLLKISKDEVERARLMSEYKYMVDTQSKVVTARREGRKEGLKKGRKEEKWEIARNLKMAGIPIRQIAQVTGFDEDQIKEL